MNPAVQDAFPPLPEPGDVVGGRFEVRDELGSGGMGHVYRVHDRQRGREVALKLLIPRYVGRSEREQRFFLEATLGQRIGHHPHIVEILESGRLGDRGDWPFITMELVEGRGLPTYLVLHGAMAPRRAAVLARQIAAAIRTMHASGVVHRDVSTANIVLQDAGVVIIDFSHAGDLRGPRVAAGEAGRLTQPHEAIGTHTCMAPEQARAEPPSASMDVYAFGIVLFELLMGRNPYKDSARDSFLPRLVAGEVSPPRIKDASVPPTLVELVSACTEPDPVARPSMDEIVQQLDRTLAAMGVPTKAAVTKLAPQAVAVHATDCMSASLPPAPAANEPMSSARSRANAWRWIAIVAMSITGLALAFTASNLRPSDDALAAGVIDGSTSSGEPSPEDETTGDAPAVARAADTSTGPEGSEGSTTAVELAIDDSAPSEPLPREPLLREPTPEPLAPPVQRKRRAPECDDEQRGAVQADLAKKWTTVLTATRHAACWKSQPDRIALRARALLNLRRYDECAALPKRHAPPEVLRMMAICAAATKKGEGSP